MNRRRSSDHSKASHERWLVSYADFVTLLFAFFVVMYATSRSDQKKVVKLAEAVQVAFSQLGLFTPTSPQLRLEAPSTPVPAAPDAAILQDRHMLQVLRDRLGRQLAGEISRQEVSLNLSHQGLVIHLQELGFFDSGSDQLRPESAPILQTIAASIAPLPNALRIEGHTDNVPIHNDHFASNWQLSTSRASEIVRRLITDDHIAPERLAAAGYAEFHPIASNATEAGRRLNRRVDVVVVSLEAARAMEGAGAGPPAPAGTPEPPPPPR